MQHLPGTGCVWRREIEVLLGRESTAAAAVDLDTLLLMPHQGTAGHGRVLRVVVADDLAAVSN